MAAGPILSKRACVIGGNGFMGSWLVKLLLERGYEVNATVRNPENLKKVSHLLELKSLGQLTIFKANLINQASFNDPISGCEVVFHVATPINFASEHPEEDMIKPAVEGVLNVLKASAKAGSVKRVILTSSAAAVTISQLHATGMVMDESNWSDVEFLMSRKPPTWGYPVSKTLAEKAAWNFAEENGVDLVTVCPALITGPSLSPEVPSSIDLAMSLITGNEVLINGLKNMQMLSGSISISHVEDVCRAHIFVAEKPSSSGRYICCAFNTSVSELSKILDKRYPIYKVSTEFGDFPSTTKLIISSTKLVKEGFNFKYGIEEIYDQSVAYFKRLEMLKGQCKISTKITENTCV